MSEGQSYLRFGVEGQSIRVWTSDDRSSFFDLSLDDAARALAALATNIKRATYVEGAKPSDKRVARLALTPDQFEIDVGPGGSAFLVFSFQNFCNIRIPIPDEKVRQTADELKMLADTPRNMRYQTPS